jgi:hypothetical protein
VDNDLFGKTASKTQHNVEDPEHPSHYNAIDGILNRTDLHEVSESKKTVVHTIDAQELIAKIRAMSERLGIVIDPAKLLPQKKQPALPKCGQSVAPQQAIETSKLPSQICEPNMRKQLSQAIDLLNELDQGLRSKIKAGDEAVIRRIELLPSRS